MHHIAHRILHTYVRGWIETHGRPLALAIDLGTETGLEEFFGVDCDQEVFGIWMNRTIPAGFIFSHLNFFW